MSENLAKTCQFREGRKIKEKTKKKRENEWIETSFIQNEWKAYLKNNNIRKSDKAP